MKANIPGYGSVSGVFGTVGANQDLVYKSLTSAVNEISLQIVDAIQTQNHSTSGALPDLTVHFQNGTSAVMPASVYARENEEGELENLSYAGRSSIVRQWIAENTPDALKGKRLFVALTAHHSQIWKYKQEDGSVSINSQTKDELIEAGLIQGQ